jgi:hypothetical protein
MVVVIRRVTLTIALALVIMFSTIFETGYILDESTYFAVEDEGQIIDNSSTNWSAHAPVWKVGDLWTYVAVLDGQSLVDGSPELEGAELDLLYGTATLQVMGVEELIIDEEIIPVYRAVTSAVVVGDGTDVPLPEQFPGDFTIDGYLTASLVLTEYFRVGDLALIEYDKHIVMSFTGEISFIQETVDIADFVEYGVYTPPLEFYDFPLAMNESWNSVTNLTKTYSGSSDVVTLPGEPEYFDQEWQFLVNATGDGGFSGCENSTKLWQTNSDGEVEEWRWWCPEVNQYSSRWTSDIALGGVDAELTLTSYQPAANVMSVNVEINPTSSPLSSEVDCWVNITDSSGINVSGKSGYIYLTGVNRISFTTSDNGSAYIRLKVGNTMDDTPTSDDWATHGVVAYLHSDQSVGAFTLTLEGSAIGGLLRQEANRFASQAGAITFLLDSQFESSFRY